MLPILLLMATTVGSFSYHTVTLSDRTKKVASAPTGYTPSWKEHVEAIVATDARDAGLSRFLRAQAIRLQQDYYNGDGGPSSFESFSYAGWVEVSEEVIAASPDIVSVSMGTSFYLANMAHPNSENVSHVVWSRRLQRPLAQDDVLAVPPDHALRQLALSSFDNREQLCCAPMTDGLPLEWDHASIGPDGITWSFGPYELGGYLSAGSATIGWSALKPYLRHDLPFRIEALREVRATDGTNPPE
jgi:hypothetical protein